MKAYAKVNIFLKITGKRDNYHELISRFMLVKNLYDEIEFIESKEDNFNIEGIFSCSIEKNSITKAYKLLLEHTNNKELEDYFKSHKVVVKKSIPEFAGLGGGSSNAATFIKMVNEELNLKLTIKELVSICVKIGADVPFFLYGYDSANVSGIGEVVERFDEKALDIITDTPKEIKCDTPSVYKTFREHYYKEISKDKIEILKKQTSKEILDTLEPDYANDLFIPAKHCYNSLDEYHKDGWFFSGSGSTFFKVNNG